MGIAVRCSCGKRLRAKDELAGRRIKCPGCGNILPVPAPAAVAAEPLPHRKKHLPEHAPAAASAKPASRRWLAVTAAVLGVLLLVCLVVAGWFFFQDRRAMESDNHLRYTVRDINGTRSSRNRESVLKTIGMTGDQIQAWAKEGSAGEDRSVATSTFNPKFGILF